MGKLNTLSQFIYSVIAIKWQEFNSASLCVYLYERYKPNVDLHFCSAFMSGVKACKRAESTSLLKESGQDAVKGHHLAGVVRVSVKHQALL